MDPNLSYFENLDKENTGNIIGYSYSSSDNVSNSEEDSEKEWTDECTKCCFCFRYNLYDENGVRYPPNGTYKEFPRNVLFSLEHETWEKEKMEPTICNECADYMIKIYDKYDLDKDGNNANNHTEALQTILMLSQTQIDSSFSSLKHLSTHCYTCNNLFFDESDKFEFRYFCGGNLCGLNGCNIQQILPFKKDYWPNLCSLCNSIFVWNPNLEEKVQKILLSLYCYRCSRIAGEELRNYILNPIPEKICISWTELEKTLSLIEKQCNFKFNGSHKEKIQHEFKKKKEKFMKKFNNFCLCVDKSLPFTKNETLHIKKLIFNWFYPSSNPWENEKLNCKKMKIERD